MKPVLIFFFLILVQPTDTQQQHEVDSACPSWCSHSHMCSQPQCLGCGPPLCMRSAPSPPAPPPPPRRTSAPYIHTHAAPNAAIAPRRSRTPPLVHHLTEAGPPSTIAPRRPRMPAFYRAAARSLVIVAARERRLPAQVLLDYSYGADCNVVMVQSCSAHDSFMFRPC